LTRAQLQASDEAAMKINCTFGLDRFVAVRSTAELARGLADRHSSCRHRRVYVSVSANATPRVSSQDNARVVTAYPTLQPDTCLPVCPFFDVARRCFHSLSPKQKTEITW